MTDRTDEDLGPQEIIDDLQADIAAANAAKEQAERELDRGIKGVKRALATVSSTREEFTRIISERDAAEADAKAKGEKLTAIEGLAANPSWCYDDNDQNFQYVDPSSILAILHPTPEQPK